MLSPELLKIILPGIITRVAVNYPIAYINSVSFQIKSKVIAACFWNEKSENKEPGCFFKISDGHNPGYFIFHSSADINTSEVEIAGTDESGNAFMVSMPYNHILAYKIAS